MKERTTTQGAIGLFVWSSHINTARNMCAPPGNVAVEKKNFWSTHVVWRASPWMLRGTEKCEGEEGDG